MTSRIEDYALIGDCETAALVGRDGSIDWLCWPRFDSDACFAALLGTPEHGRWLHRAATTATCDVTRRYRPNTLILETRFETADGAATLIDFMPPRDGNSDIVRLVVGERGRVPMRMPNWSSASTTAPPCPGSRASTTDTLRAIAGPDMVVLRTPVASARRGLEDRRRVHRRRRRDRAVRADLRRCRTCPPPEPIDAAAAPCARPRHSGREWAGASQIARRVARGGDALADHAEGADLRADRRHRRGADDLAAGTARRRAQLGLPLLLAARRHADAAGADERRLLRGSAHAGATGCCAPPPAARARCRSCTASPASAG